MNDSLTSKLDQKKKPFIIWTVQRTGGTNLANMLFKRSPQPVTQHEPFNGDRVFGNVVAAWHANKDSGQLDASLKDIATRGVLIKHCLEMFDLEFNMALASAMNSKGYRHLFLFRRNSLDRLLSLHFAKVTGVWGKPKSNNVDNKVKPFMEPVPIKQLLAHEKRCIFLMTSIHNYIQELGGPILSLAFEDIYLEEDNKRACERIFNLLNWLDISRGEEEDRLFVEKVIKEGGQGTKSRYLEFPGANALRDALDNLKSFSG